MLYNLKSPIDHQRAKDRFNELIETDKVIELKEKRERTLNQNNYLHLILSWYGMELGYTKEEAKEIYKRLNKEIYLYEKNGKKFFKSSSDLDTVEMTKTIEVFRNHSSSEAGVYLPEPHEKDFLNEIEVRASKNRYL